MKVIRYTNGKKVQELVQNDEPTPPAIVPAPVKRVVTKITTPAPPQAQPTKGCGCGR